MTQSKNKQIVRHHFHRDARFMSTINKILKLNFAKMLRLHYAKKKMAY